MTTFEVTANGKTFKAGEDPVEACAYEGELTAQVDDAGRMIDRPTNYEANVCRKMPRKTGTLPLFETAVSGQAFNILAAALDQHPKAKIVLAKKVGNMRVPVTQIDLQDMQPRKWTLTWTGGGNDGLKGCHFVESLDVVASRGKITDPATNIAVPFDLD